MARVVGFGRRCESSARTLAPTGAAIRAAIEAALADAELSASDIGCVNAHGLSTMEDDPVEAQAIRDVLGEVAVTAPKSFMGNLGAGGGAVEAAISLLGLEAGVIPPTLNYETPDPVCPVRVVTDLEPLAQTNIMCLNHNQLGQAVALIFAAP